MYYRVYCKKSNTIFKKNSGPSPQVSGNINTGQNTIAELMDGNGVSYHIMQFDLAAIKDLLQNNQYTVKLKLFDAGQLFEPALLPQDLNLYFFEEDFLEGDGWSYLTDGKISVSNFNLRDNGNDWDNVFDSNDMVSIPLNNAGSDLEFTGIKDFIDTSLTNEINPNFALKAGGSINAVSDVTYTKFIYTSKTRTIYKPYLEFEIKDEVVDNRRNFIAGENGNLFLINKLNQNFVGTLTCNIVDEEGEVITSLTPTNFSPGKYKITYQPSLSNIGQYFNDVWLIDGQEIYRNIFQINSPNQVMLNEENQGLYFYPTSSLIQPLVRKGDRLKINIISEVKGKGSVLNNKYEFKVVNTANFEMQPWQTVNCHNDYYYCFIDTSFYFEDMEYEVFVRMNNGDGEIKTSNLSYRFRVITDSATHLKTQNTTPYTDRLRNLKK